MLNSLKLLLYKSRNFLTKPIVEERNNYHRSMGYTTDQLLLKIIYKWLSDTGHTLPKLCEVGFKVSSQSDEDGKLLFIFSILGTLNKKCIEICAGNGIECNTANLIINHGWSGLLVDANSSLVKQGQEFYKNNPNTYVYPPIFINEWITRDNVNDIIRLNGFEGDIDLLSIDMDGVDYWIWEAIEVANPRVVIVEYQDIIGPEKSLSVPYSNDFNAYEYPTTNGMPNFCGASLPAFVKLAKNKGYRLVGCNIYGYNAFFMRNNLAIKEIPEITIEECFKHPKVLWGMKTRFPLVKDLPWVKI